MFWHHVAMNLKPHQGLRDATGGAQIRTRWPDDATENAAIATHFVASVDGTQSDMGIYLLVGQAVPPIWLTKEDADEGMERTGGVVPIRLRGAFYMTRDKARDLHELLGNYLHANPESGD